MGNIPNFGPEVIKGVAISTGVFFGFRNRTSSVRVRNVDASDPLLYHFQILSDASPFITLTSDEKEHPIVDSVMGIHVKSPAGVTTDFEVIAAYDYLR